MAAKPSNLLMLLRLLDNDLPALVAEQLRARILAERELATLFRQIQICAAEPTDAPPPTTTVNKADADVLAAFLSQSLPQSEVRAIEERCLQSPELLREIVSLWRGLRTSAQSAIAMDTTTNQPADIHRLQAEPPSTPDPPNTANVPQSPAPDLPSGTFLQTSSEPTSLPQTDPKSILKTSSVSPLSSLVILLFTMSVIAFLLLSFLFNNLPRQLVQPDAQQNSATDDVAIPDRTAGAGLSQDDTIENLMQDPDDLASPLEAQPSGRDTPMDVPPIRIARQPDTPALLPSSAAATRLVTWFAISGVAAARPEDGANWSGVFSEASQNLWTVTQPSHLLTLPWSRAEGELAGGAKIIADAETQFELAAASKSASSSSADEPTPIAQLTLQQGRLAIEGLPAGQKLLVHIGRQLLEFEATAEATFALERSGDETLVAAYRGELLTAVGPLSRRNWATVNTAGQMQMFRPVRRTEWFRSSERPEQLPESFCTTVNRADLFSTATAVAAEPENTPSAEVQLVSVIAALHSATVTTNVMPRQLAGELSSAPEEWKRAGLLQWLLARFRQDLRLGEASLREVCLAQRTPARTTFAMIGWFQSAALNQTPTAALLTELMEGLRGSAPLFTRQCACWFLQRILNDPLPLYSVDQPNRREGLADITEKVRNWQQLNR